MIGKTAGRFEHYLSRMLNDCTAIYKLATLENDQFDRVAESELLAPSLEIDGSSTMT
jgi:hypothetical protein